MWTIRLRLTLWYGGLFLLLGFVVLALNFALVSRNFPPPSPMLREQVAERMGMPTLTRPGGELRFRGQPGDVARLLHFEDLVLETQRQLRSDTLRQLFIQSSIALAMMSVVSVGVGWVIAGRMLRPISEITDTVRAISGQRLTERVGLSGPHDELKDLADQFDVMLDRLEEAFHAQRDFVANASHELRTPLAIMRVETDVTLADPEATADELRASAEVIRRSIERSEALIAALLTLARADAPRTATDEVDIAETVRMALAERESGLAERALTVRASLAPAVVIGDRVLLERLVENLLENATRHNHDGGWIEVESGSDGPDSVLRVANSGDVIPPDRVQPLFERFSRLDSSRSRESGGFGLGLAIVGAVATHHGADVEARALPGGGLEVRVRFAAAS